MNSRWEDNFPDCQGIHFHALSVFSSIGTHLSYLLTVDAVFVVWDKKKMYKTYSLPISSLSFHRSNSRGTNWVSGVWQICGWKISGSVFEFYRSFDSVWSSSFFKWVFFCWEECFYSVNVRSQFIEFKVSPILCIHCRKKFSFQSAILPE